MERDRHGGRGGGEQKDKEKGGRAEDRHMYGWTDGQPGTLWEGQTGWKVESPYTDRHTDRWKREDDLLQLDTPLCIVRPWDTLACCWDFKQPANKQSHCVLAAYSHDSSVPKVFASEKSWSAGSTAKTARCRNRSTSLDLGNSSRTNITSMSILWWPSCPSHARRLTSSLYVLLQRCLNSSRVPRHLQKWKGNACA